MRFLELSISELCYMLYKAEWKNSHISKDRELNSIKSYYEELVNGGYYDFNNYSYYDYIEEFGYDEELYVDSFEFMDNEYLDKDYIRELLNDEKLYESYLKDLNNLEIQ